MNIVLDQSEEVNTKTGAKRPVGEWVRVRFSIQASKKAIRARVRVRQGQRYQ
jgi:hypothetical protein